MGIGEALRALTPNPVAREIAGRFLFLATPQERGLRS